ncbi:methyl-accepting chemotaxis protein [Rhodoferax fermentans]|uniref:Methyl-accepting chemotaxis protein n=3 Tax=Rhodoferax fermentans TaxID=28066 RepID=A0A1T1AN37_RHOFE|nr:methyl-accepting chemotaxis protein [Rhodoferax fermentans]OOV05447.1 methyl-accepting chemotaxis protein [Rhodoferax fermentans]
MNLQNLRLTTKLWLSVLLIVLALVTVVGYTAYRTAENRAESAQALHKLNARVNASLGWAGLTQTNAARTQAIMLSSDPVLEAGLKEAMADTTAQISKIQKTIEDDELTDDDRQQMKVIAANRKKMIEARTAAVKERSEGRPEQATAIVKDSFQPAMQAYQQSQRDFVTLQEKSFLATEEEFAHRAQNLIYLTGAMMLLLVVGILVGAAWLIRSIRQPLDTANNLAAKIAQGDLSMAIDTSRSDEFGDLMKSLSSMNASLGTMVNQVRHSTDSIATASSEIAQGNNDLAQRTEQTSSNLQATASSMDHLTQTVQLSADNARQASSLAANASSVAERGGAVVRQVVSTMEEINDSSRKISDIIGVIDGIAFQTNILALNAAVEAARAGEQGRGFAVVASEVRSLAQRSAEAAKEIKMLINTSVTKVASGTQLVSDAGSTMNDIVQSVRKVADVIGEITAASGEQSSEISGINQSIGNLDQMTQQNAALVEQSAAAAESLRDQAEQLAQAVAVFKTDGQALSMAQRPPRDITPRAPSLGHKAAAAPAPKKLAASVKPAAGKPTAPKPALGNNPAPAKAAAGAESDWESF